MINLIIKRTEAIKIRSTFITLSLLAGGFSILAVLLNYTEFIEMIGKATERALNEAVILSLVIVSPIIVYLFTITIRTIVFTLSMVFLSLDEGFRKIFSLMTHLSLVEVSSSAITISVINIFNISINKYGNILIKCPFFIFQIFIVNSFLYSKTSKRRRIVLIIIFALITIIPELFFGNSISTI